MLADEDQLGISKSWTGCELQLQLTVHSYFYDVVSVEKFTRQ